MVVSKVNVKDSVNDGEIDLSMLNLQDVPVKEIAAVKKAHSLDLSNNNLSILPKNFPTLVNLIKLDLSKNQLKELPENFGDLVKLKHLDLYKNQLQHLPLSFSKLTVLKWLDLKDNPLVPSISEVAGHCLDAKQCQKCAKDIIVMYSRLQMKVDEERKSREEQRQRSLEENAAKLKQEKKTKKAKMSRKQTEKVSEETETSKLAQTFVKVKEVNTTEMNTKPSASLLFIVFILKFLSILLVLIGVSTVALKVSRVKYGSVVEDTIREFILNDRIPLQLRQTLIFIVEYVLTAQDAVTSKAVEVIGAHNINIVWSAFTGVYQNVTQAGSELYLKMVGK